jgi:hypothetical protein
VSGGAFSETASSTTTEGLIPEVSCLELAGEGAGGAAQPPLGFWELLEYIVEEAAPTLPRHDTRFSPELCDFVAKVSEAMVLQLLLSQEESCIDGERSIFPYWRPMGGHTHAPRKQHWPLLGWFKTASAHNACLCFHSVCC